MSNISAQELSKINSFFSLVDLLRDKLDWPIGDDYGFEDVVYDYQASELGLKAEEIAKIREIHQLRPLKTDQPWGIFFLSLEEKKISVTVLRRMLRSLVVRKRQGAQDSDRQSWQLHDLIFVTNFGLSGERELAISHFSDAEETGDLPILNVLGWNRQDTRLHNEYVAEMLGERLNWPEDPDKLDDWRNQWSSAFEIRHGQVIRTSKELAVQLAALAGNIRARANELLAAETDEGRLRKMLEAFRKNLIHDLDEDGFADMFAQTISYGLLAAHISRPSGGLVADNLVDMVPKTNPFLRELFSTFLSLGGRDKRQAMDFDELGVRDVVDMLRKANMEAVRMDFGNRNPKKDPVIHFYEDFLREYDAQQKVDAGIFYTPPAVVSFIVRGVDEVLREELGLSLGLADTTTWRELAERNSEISVPEHVSPETPFVQILDPAAGTGTFLVEVIDLIHKRMSEHWKAAGMPEAEVIKAWNAYVPEHLLPRLTAFELKMAAYAIAHMKVGLKLTETGYRFGSNERAHILLTNSLQPSRELDLEELMRLEALAHEAERANEAKENSAFTVVIGNPPYKGNSENPSKIKGKLTFAGELVQRFFQVRGEPLNERNPKWLNNDYVKFIGLAMSLIEKSCVGVLGYITSNSWLDSPTFRGVRTEMIDAFPLLRIVDLHGNVKKKEIAPDGSKDEGVFAIEEGTNITLAVMSSKISSIHQIDVWGQQVKEGHVGKLYWLENSNLASLVKTLEPVSPLYLMVPSDIQFRDEYLQFKEIKDISPTNGVGMVTARDHLVIGFKNDPILLERIYEFGNSAGSDEQVCKALGVPLKKGWNYQAARKDVGAITDLSQFIKAIRYRPFDQRSIFYHRSVVWRTVEKIMGEMLHSSNLGLITARAGAVIGDPEWNIVTVTDTLTEFNLFRRGGHCVFPLWLKPTSNETCRRPNVNRNLALAFGKSACLSYEDGIRRVEQAYMGAEYRQEAPEQKSLIDGTWDGRGDLHSTFGPRDLFDWIYAVLHSPGYRGRYAEFLKSDFPRIPMPRDSTIFQALISLGTELVALHLLKPDEAPVLEVPEVTFHGTGEARVANGYPKHQNGKVMINPTRWFEDVLLETWEFHVGGYQICQKWLKDRAGKGGKNPTDGRILTDDDILHYRRTVTALTETRRVMAEIDRVIDDHGGWPDAFYVPPPPPPTIEKIIQADESRELEFKSTFQWDVRESKQNKELRKSVLKTLAAFMNSEGGTLVIGVTDDKEILGLDDDLKLTRQSLDVFEQTVFNVFESAIGVGFVQHCPMRFEDATDGKKVCVIEVQPSSEPAFVSFQGKEEFFIRRGNVTKGLEASDQHDYIRKRFN